MEIIIHASTRSGRVGVARRFIDLSGEYNAHTVDRIAGGEVGLTLRNDEAASKVNADWEEALLPSPSYRHNERSLPENVTRSAFKWMLIWQKSAGSAYQRQLDPLCLHVAFKIEQNAYKPYLFFLAG